MKQKEKSAIVRLLSDLIKADTVIDTREIDLFEKICSRYNIDVPETLVEAQKLTLSEALSALEALSASERRTLVEDLENIAIADGKCEPEEALLLLALRQILSGLPFHSAGITTVFRYQPSPMYLWRIGFLELSHTASQHSDIPGSPIP